MTSVTPAFKSIKQGNRCHRQIHFACDSPVTPVTVLVQSDTIPGSGDGGECFGGEANAHVPAISATLGSALLVVNPWHNRPQLAAEVGGAAGNVAVVVAPDVPCQLQIVPTHFLAGFHFAALFQECLDRRRQVHEIPQDFSPAVGFLNRPTFLSNRNPSSAQLVMPGISANNRSSRPTSSRPS